MHTNPSHFREDGANRPVENVTWPDSSLGCPEEGTQYAQMLTDGVLIVLELDGQQYEYHAALGDEAFYCENPQPPVG